MPASTHRWPRFLRRARLRPRGGVRGAPPAARPAGGSAGRASPRSCRSPRWRAWPRDAPPAGDPCATTAVPRRDPSTDGGRRPGRAAPRNASSALRLDVAERFDELPVVVVAEQRGRLVGRAPPQLVDLVVGDDAGVVDRLHHPVPNLLRAAAAVPVVDR